MATKQAPPAKKDGGIKAARTVANKAKRVARHVRAVQNKKDNPPKVARGTTRFLRRVHKHQAYEELSRVAA